MSDYYHILTVVNAIDCKTLKQVLSLADLYVENNVAPLMDSWVRPSYSMNPATNHWYHDPNQLGYTNYLTNMSNLGERHFDVFPLEMLSKLDLHQINMFVYENHIVNMWKFIEKYEKKYKIKPQSVDGYYPIWTQYSKRLIDRACCGAYGSHGFGVFYLGRD